MASEFETAHGVDPLDDMQSLQALRVSCESAIWSLLDRRTVKVSVSSQGQHGDIEVTYEVFVETTVSLLAQTIELTQRCIQRASELDAVVDEVLMVGSASRMPQVSEALEAAFGLVPRIFEPEVAVVKGAALRAEAILRGRLDSGVDEPDVRGTDLDSR